MTKPFRFGVQISNAASAAAWRDKARKLEDLGYSTLFMPDHFGEELAPMPAIAMAAAHTTTLKIGALVFDNDYKHPAILAKESATIDLLCDGRLELGIGAGWMKTDYDALGLDYDPPAVRVDRFEEALHVIKQCFTGEKFTYHGEHYRITDYASYPKPAQAHVPILVGGGGKRVLSIAAREADIIGINPNLRAGEVGLEATTDSLQEQTDRKIGWVRDAAGARHRRHRDPDAVLHHQGDRRPHGPRQRDRSRLRRRRPRRRWSRAPRSSAARPRSSSSCTVVGSVGACRT